MAQQHPEELRPPQPLLPQPAVEEQRARLPQRLLRGRRHRQAGVAHVDGARVERQVPRLAKPRARLREWPSPTALQAAEARAVTRRTLVLFRLAELHPLASPAPPPRRAAARAERLLALCERRAARAARALHRRCWLPSPGSVASRGHFIWLSLRLLRWLLLLPLPLPLLLLPILHLLMLLFLLLLSCLELSLREAAEAADATADALDAAR